jgi:hypothetical protein
LAKVVAEEVFKWEFGMKKILFSLLIFVSSPITAAYQIDYAQALLFLNDTLSDRADLKKEGFVSVLRRGLVDESALKHANEASIPGQLKNVQYNLEKLELRVEALLQECLDKTTKAQSKPVKVMESSQQGTQLVELLSVAQKNHVGGNDYAGEFQLSTVNPKKITDPQVFPQQINLLGGAPTIGVYGTPYVWRLRTALIELAPKSLVEVPEVVLNRTIEALKIPGDLIAKRKFDAAELQRIKLHVLISGPLQSQERVNNLLFHGWAAGVENSARFNAGVPMAAFLGRGVKATSAGSIAFDQALRAESVNPHDPNDLSPNNARFEIEAGRNIVSFWSVAAYKGAATITFHVIINDPKLNDRFKACSKTAQMALDFVNCLDALSALLGAGQDKTTLDAARVTIAQLLSA